MSNENLFYGNPYSSVRPSQDTYQTEQQNNYSTSVTTSPTPYHGLRATAAEAAAAARAFGAPQYQSQRYMQQPPTVAESYIGFHNSISKSSTVQRPHQLNLGEVREQHVRDDSGFINKPPYQSIGFNSYAYASNVDYDAVQKDGRTRISSGARSGVPDDEVLSTPAPYQPYTGRSNDHLRSPNTALSAAQHVPAQDQWHNSTNHLPDNQSGKSYIPPAPSSTGYNSSVNSTSRVPMNVALPRNSGLSTAKYVGSREVLRRNSTRVNHPLLHSSQQGPTSTYQSIYSHRGENTTTPSSISGGRRELGNKELSPHNARMPNSPVSVSQSSGIPTNQANRIQHKHQAGSVQRSNLAVAPNISQSRTQSKIDLPYSKEKVSESFCRASLALHDQISPQPAQPSQLQSSKDFIPPQDTITTQQSLSSTILTTVDPSHVYNRYHEYKKQIEVAEAEHARLAAAKAEREVAEVVAAGAIAHVHSRDGPEFGNELRPNSNEVIAADDIQSLVGSNMRREAYDDRGSNTRSFTDQANQNQPSSIAQQHAIRAATPQTRPSSVSPAQSHISAAVDPAVVAAMEEEMRQMVEKMREYQKQDPKLFSQIWESVKKTQGPPSVKAQANAGERLLHTSTDMHTTKRPNPTSKIASQGSVATVEDGILSSIKAPRQRKSSSKVAIAKRAAEHAALLASQKIQHPVDVGLGHLGSAESSLTTNLPQNARNMRPYVPMQLPSGPNKSSISTTIITPPVQGPFFDLQYTNLIDSSRNRSPIGTKRYPEQATVKTVSPVLVEPALLSAGPSSIMSENSEANRNMPNTPAPTRTSNKPGMISGHFGAVVLWPEKHRNAIAAMASKVINTIPENEGKAIHASQILDMLNYNPSYVELCEIIERMGFKMNRARFAERILAVIRGDETTTLQAAETRNLSQMPVGTTSTISKEPETQNAATFVQDKEPLSTEWTAPRRIVFTSSEVENSSSKVTSPSKSIFPNTKPGLRGPRGPYKKTRDRIVALQKNTSNSRSGLNTLQQSVTPPIQAQAPWQDPFQQPTSQGPDQNPREEHHQQPTFTGPAQSRWSVQIDNSAGSAEPKKAQGLSSTATKSLVATKLLLTPTTKEMTARKRTFAEIIDLSSSALINAVDNDHSPRTHKTRRANTTNHEKDNEYGAGKLPLAKINISTTPHENITTLAYVNNPAQQDNADVKTITQPLPNPSGNFEDIVKPITKSVPLRKSRYDPKTIACDILISTSQHPFQRGLNAHLEQLKHRFTKINDSADLATLRWDLLDPGGVPVGSANMSSHSTELLNQSSTDSQTDPAKKRNVMNITTPTVRENLRPTRGGSSLRGKRGSGRQSHQASVPAQPSGLRYSSTADPVSNFAVIIDSTAPPANAARLSPGGAPKGLQKDLQDRDNLPSLSPRRVGRPPKQAYHGTEILTIPIKRKIGRPRIHPLTESKRKNATVDPKSVFPKFIPFLCEWKNCKAELHNLETLRRHIFTVHNRKRSSDKVLCQWANCGSQDLVRDKITLTKVTMHKPYDFNSIDSWKDHTERNHLIPLAWHMGDGPRGSTLDGNESDGTAYGSEKSSQQINPSIDGLTEETESVKVRNFRQSSERNRPINPSLEATVRLVSSVMQAGFYMPENSGWTQKKRRKRETDLEALPTFSDSLGSDDV